MCQALCSIIFSNIHLLSFNPAYLCSPPGFHPCTLFSTLHFLSLSFHWLSPILFALSPHVLFLSPLNSYPCLSSLLFLLSLSLGPSAVYSNPPCQDHNFSGTNTAVLSSTKAWKHSRDQSKAIPPISADLIQKFSRKKELGAALFWSMICDTTQGGSDGKESTCKAGGLGSIPVLGRSSGEGNGYPLQYSCLENPMDREA